MDFYNQLLAQKLSGGGGGGDQYAAFKALVDRSITDVTADMLDGVTTINFYAFDRCVNLTSVEISNSVTAIGDNAFSNCVSLTSLTIPNSVTSIANFAFQNCSVLSSVTVQATNPPTIGNDVFRYTHANLVIYVPAASVDAYKSASGWSTYADIIQAIPSG